MRLGGVLMRKTFAFSMILVLVGTSAGPAGLAAAADWKSFEKRIPNYELEPEERDGKVFCGSSSIAAVQRIEPGSLNDNLRGSIFKLAYIDQSYRSATRLRPKNEEAWADYLRQVREAVEEAEGEQVDSDSLLPMLERFYARFALNRCQIKAYRARALEMAPVRREAEVHYREAVAALEAAEAGAERACEEHPKRSRPWQRCQDAASLERGKLQSRVNLAKTDWERILNPPDYGSELPEATPERLKPELARAAFEKRIPRFELKPRMLGDEVLCGQIPIRSASQTADPLLEFGNVMSKVKNGPRNLERTRTHYEDQLEKVRSWLDQTSHGVTPSQLDAQIEELEKRYGRYQRASCELLWFERRAQELASFPAAIESEYRDADDAYNEVAHRCEKLKPEAKGWIRADARTKDWVTCKSTSIEEHTRRLRELKRARARWDDVQRATGKADQ